MPYIPTKNRPSLDVLMNPLIEEIVKIHKEYGYDGAFAGILNYCFTRISTRVATLLFGRVRYWIVALLRGVLKDVADEFYRRVAAPYEDVQAKKSGDIDTYEEMIKSIQ